MHMAIGLRAWLLLGVASAARSNLGQHNGHKVEVHMVPALISRALRVALRQSAETLQRADALQANASAVRQEAEARRERSKLRSQQTDEAMARALRKEKTLLSKQQEVNKLMATHDKSQDQWRRSAAELEELQENLTKEGGLYEDLKKRVEQEIAKLTDMQQAAYKRLGDLQDAVEKKQDGVQLLREEAESHGTVARNASRAADTVQANLAEARESINKHKALAEEAEQAFFHAKMRVDAAERMVDDSRREVARAGDVRANVLAVRNSLQSFYESMDKLTRSMEANIVAKPGSKPYQLMREDPNTKTAFLGYNNMTTAFRRLYLKSKDLYMFVAGSIPEIEENAEAAIILQCDPDGMLEEEARREGNISSFNARCGPGLWHDLQVERQSFPLDGDAERLDRELADLDMLPVEDEGLDQEEEDEGIPVPDQGQRVGLPAPGMDKIPSLHKMDAINVSDHH
ncbi:unnamed protein product [Effrenium voratum]|nr:unnamed protein product [Effrenium voratum]